MSSNTHPFKFLDPFNQEDTAFFFGREEEEKLLYSLIRRNRLVLAYGPSGSGKTSLVQCGLARKFEISEWMPIFIRRGDDINISLMTALGDWTAFRNDNADAAAMTEWVIGQLGEIRKNDLRPVYLIFDQFEELLILGTEQEQKSFRVILKALLDHYALLTCNIILLMREEYFARLDAFGKDIPGISDVRLRVEPIRLEQAKRIITRSCDYFNIRLPDPEVNAEQIVAAVAGKKDISLPYLQVYLDQMWRDDYKRDWPNGYEGEGYAPLEFTTEEIKAFGKIKNVLYRFLKQQKKDIQVELKEAFPQAPENCVADILDCFVTYDGTKLPVSYTLEKNMYKLRKQAPDLLRGLKPPILKYVLDKLEDVRILRNDDSCFELAHDTLAKLIDKQRDSEQRRLNDFQGQLQAAFKGFDVTGEYLTYREVKAYEKYIPQLKLKPELRDFFRKSRQQREEEERNRVHSKRWYNRLKALNVISSLFVVFVIVVGFGYVRQTNISYAQLYMAYTVDTISNKTDGLILARYIYNYISNAEARMQMDRKIRDLALGQSIQGRLAVFSETLNKKVFAPGEIDISRDGQYVVARDTGIVLITQGKRRALGKYAYAYFLYRSDTLLLAGDSARSDSAGAGGTLQPTRFSLYDCKRGRIFFSKQLEKKDGFLFDADYVFPAIMHNPMDNYRVKYMANGNLLVPHERNKLLRAAQVMLLSPAGEILSDVPSASTTGISKQGTQFMTLEYRGSFTLYGGGMPVVNIFDQNGRLLYDLPGLEHFADFTEKGGLIYTDGSQLLLRKPGGNTDTFTLSRDVAYVYADGDGRYAVCSLLLGTTSVVDLSNGSTTASPANLVGCNFSDGTFIASTDRGYYQQPNVTAHADSLVLQAFSGKVLEKFVCTEGIESEQYNSSSGCTLVLGRINPESGFQYLYLLDAALRVRASFGLTPNDRYGFSNDGTRIFYVRDNELSVFSNDRHLVNFTDPNVVRQWLDTSSLYLPSEEVLRSKKEQYKLHFPSEKLLFWK